MLNKLVMVANRANNNKKQRYQQANPLIKHQGQSPHLNDLQHREGEQLPNNSAENIDDNHHIHQKAIALPRVSCVYFSCSPISGPWMTWEEAEVYCSCLMKARLALIVSRSFEITVSNCFYEKSYTLYTLFLSRAAWKSLPECVLSKKLSLFFSTISYQPLYSLD